MGLFSAIAGIFGGNAQKKASQKATDATVAALNRGIDTQNAFNQQTRQDYMPYTTAGGQAATSLGEWSQAGIGGDPKALSEKIKANPLYAALFDNGEETLLQNASATGGLRGGDTQRGLADFGSDTMAQVYQQILGNLSGVAGLGLGAQGAVTQTGQNTTNSVTGLQGDIGGAKAQNFLVKGGINAKNWSNFGSVLDDAMNALVGGFGGITGASTARLNPAAQSLISSNSKIF